MMTASQNPTIPAITFQPQHPWVPGRLEFLAGELHRRFGVDRELPSVVCAWSVPRELYGFADGGHSGAVGDDVLLLAKFGATAPLLAFYRASTEGPHLQAAGEVACELVHLPPQRHQAILDEVADWAVTGSGEKLERLLRYLNLVIQDPLAWQRLGGI